MEVFTQHKLFQILKGGNTTQPTTTSQQQSLDVKACYQNIPLFIRCITQYKTPQYTIDEAYLTALRSLIQDQTSGTDLRKQWLGYFLISISLDSKYCLINDISLFNKQNLMSNYLYNDVFQSIFNLNFIYNAVLQSIFSLNFMINKVYCNTFLAQITNTVNKNELGMGNDIFAIAIKAWLTVTQRIYQNYDPKNHASALTAIKQIAQVMIKKVDKSLKVIAEKQAKSVSGGLPYIVDQDDKMQIRMALSAILKITQMFPSTLKNIVSSKLSGGQGNQESILLKQTGLKQQKQKTSQICGLPQNQYEKMIELVKDKSLDFIVILSKQMPAETLPYIPRMIAYINLTFQNKVKNGLTLDAYQHILRVLEQIAQVYGANLSQLVNSICFADNDYNINDLICEIFKLIVQKTDQTSIDLSDKSSNQKDLIKPNKMQRKDDNSSTPVLKTFQLQYLDSYTLEQNLISLLDFIISITQHSSLYMLLVQNEKVKLESVLFTILSFSQLNDYNDGSTICAQKGQISIANKHLTTLPK